MRTLRTLIGLTILSVNTMVLGQDFPQTTDLIPQFNTPEVATLGEFTAMPMNLSTGTPNISIPIYTLEYGGMSVPIYLSYDASGVRVQESASPVGLKWTLHAGGKVTRILRGGKDEGQASVGGGEDISNIDLGGYYVSNGLSNLSMLQSYSGYNAGYQLGQLLKALANGARDAQPDLFSFNTASGHSGRFFFNEDRQPLMFTEGDYKIEEYFDITRSGQLQSRFYKWEVTAPNGVKMTFGEGDLTESSYSAPHSYIPSQAYATNTWFLNRMHNPLTNRSITFEYEQESYTEVSYGNYPKAGCYKFPNFGSGHLMNTGCVDDSFGYTNTLTQGGSDGNISTPQGIANPSGPNSARLSDATVFTQRLRRIVAGNTTIEFIGSAREDLSSGTNPSNAKRIDEVVVKYNGQCVKRIRLLYDYFVADENSWLIYPKHSSSDLWERANLKRLKLTGLHEVSCEDGAASAHYAFSYQESPKLPPRASFAQDKWGYYNGKLGNRSLFPRYKDATVYDWMGDRSVSPSHTLAGTLTSIRYPTSGTVEFEYENHVHDESVNEEREDVYDWVGDNSLTTGGFAYGVSHGNVPYVERTISQPDRYKIDITLYLGHTYPGDNMTQDSQCRNDEVERAVEILDMSNNVIWYTTFTDLVANSTVRGQVSLPPIIREVYPSFKIRCYFTYRSDGRQCMSSQARLSTWEYIPPSTSDYLVGGLRVNRVTHRDHDGTAAKSATYEYLHPKLVDNPGFLYNFDYNMDLTFNGMYSTDNTPDFMLTTNLNLKDGSFKYVTPGQTPYVMNFQGPHMAYQRVTERSSEGRTEYFYHTPKTYQELSSYNISYPIRPLDQSSLAGKVMSMEVYDKAGNKLRREESTYEVTYLTPPVEAVTVSRIGDEYTLLPATFYEMRPETALLKQRVVRNFLEGQEVATTTEYFHQGNGHHQVTRTRTTNSKGEQMETRTRYAGDVGNATLLSQHRLAEPVESEQYKGSTRLARQRTGYGSFSGRYLPLKVEVSKGSGGLEERVRYERYDANGNLLQYRQTNGTQVAFLWGYGGRYPVAKVENAAYDQMVGTGVNLSIINGTDPSDASMRTELDKVRQGLPNAMVTTYTYDPLVGVTSVTDPKGYTSHYEYDAFQRLECVRDAEGNILSQNQYHYKGQ